MLIIAGAGVRGIEYCRCTARHGARIMIRWDRVAGAAEISPMPRKKKQQQDEPKAGGASTAAAGAATKTRPKEESKEKVKELPPYHVVLLNDDDHSYEYVIEMLKALFGHPAEMGYKLAQQVDDRGRAIVLTTHKEKAELKRDQIHSYGVDYRVATCQGSMSAIVQPADTGA